MFAREFHVALLAELHVFRDCTSSIGARIGSSSVPVFPIALVALLMNLSGPIASTSYHLMSQPSFPLSLSLSPHPLLLAMEWSLCSVKVSTIEISIFGGRQQDSFAGMVQIKFDRVFSAQELCSPLYLPFQAIKGQEIGWMQQDHKALGTGCMHIIAHYLDHWIFFLCCSPCCSGLFG